jgi:hypothetical protein
MPAELEACISSIFEPGNPGNATDSGAITVPRYPIIYDVSVLEAATAAATVNAGLAYTSAVAEAASAAAVESAALTLTATAVESASAADVPDAAVVAGSVPATWEPATVAAVTLSGGNLVATNTGTTSTNQGAHVASTSGKTSGKYYFEMTWTAITGGGNYGVGIGTTASTYTGMGNNATVGTMNFRAGNTYSNGSQVLGSVGAWGAGQVAGIAVDLDNRRFWVRTNPAGVWNQSATNNPATNVGGLVIPAGTMVPFVTFGGTSGSANNVITANFGASTFTGAVPSGFTSGWPA